MSPFHKRLFLILCCFFLSSFYSIFASQRILFPLGGSYNYTNSQADRVTGASYSRTYTNPLIANAGVGTIVWEALYLGARYDYWFAGRTLTQSGSTQTDTLNYQTVGAEFGYFTSNPRVYFYFLAGANYPVVLNVSAVTDGTASSFTNTAMPISYQARALLGIRFSRFHSFYADFSYRLANLGNLTSGATQYIDGANFDLSGLSLGAGLLIEFRV